MKVIMEDDWLEAETAEESQDISEAEHAGLLTLLVDDNETNRLVMSMQISSLGYTFMIASDGQEALDLFRQHSFALILTDCSMPEMDGYQLAAAIRQAEGTSGMRTPIVAVTANADDKEVTHCLNCGMDDCIFKPVKLEVLQSVFDRWLTKEVPPSFSINDNVKYEVGSEIFEVPSPVDSAVLQGLLGDDAAMHDRMLAKYSETSPAIFNSMISAVEEGDLHSVVIATHKFKSSSRAIGAGQLADLIQSMEDAAMARENERVLDLASLITEEFDRVIQYINCNGQGSIL